MTTRGPVHLDRRATTSARRERSVKATFGWDFSWRQASSVGITSGRDSEACCSVKGVEIEAGPHDPLPHRLGLPQQARAGALSSTAQELEGFPWPGQFAQGASDATLSPTAVQNAFPKTSSAQAIQFDGSPEQVAEDEGASSAVPAEGMITGKTGF